MKLTKARQRMEAYGNLPVNAPSACCAEVPGAMILHISARASAMEMILMAANVADSGLPERRNDIDEMGVFEAVPSQCITA